jgi:hypothetical protein
VSPSILGVFNILSFPERVAFDQLNHPSQLTNQYYFSSSLYVVNGSRQKIND